MVQLPRLERGTPRSTIWCSNQLSYSCTLVPEAADGAISRLIVRRFQAPTSGTAGSPGSASTGMRGAGAVPRLASGPRLHCGVEHLAHGLGGLRHRAVGDPCESLGLLGHALELGARVPG